MPKAIRPTTAKGGAVAAAVAVDAVGANPVTARRAKRVATKAPHRRTASAPPGKPRVPRKSVRRAKIARNAKIGRRAKTARNAKIARRAKNARNAKIDRHAKIDRNAKI